MAAERRNDEELTQLQRVISSRREALEEPARLHELNAEMLHLIAKATHNRVYQLIVNTLGRVFLQFRKGHGLPPEYNVFIQDILEELLRAIVAQDGDAAERAMSRHGAVFHKLMKQTEDSRQEPEEDRIEVSPSGTG
jgi:DNA-binding FadR family transcriptional regulator